MLSLTSISSARRFVTAAPNCSRLLPTRCESFIPHRRFHHLQLICTPSSRICCTHQNKEPTGGFLEDFSVIPQDVPLEIADVWTTMALYFFSLHIPISFGGLSVISEVLHQPELDPLTEAVSALLLQTTELAGALAFLHYIPKQQHRPFSIFPSQDMPNSRSLIKASLVGLGVLFFFAFFTSFLADQLIGPKDVNDLALHEVLNSSPAAKLVCFLMYCFVTPVLEEIVYRRFLLTSLSSTMKWQLAVVLSALTFSFAHLSPGNAPQLFVVGAVLGCVYCWTGNLASSIIVHSAYNAAILVITSLN